MGFGPGLEVAPAGRSTGFEVNDLHVTADRSRRDLPLNNPCDS